VLLVDSKVTSEGEVALRIRAELDLRNIADVELRGGVSIRPASGKNVTKRVKYACPVI